MKWVLRGVLLWSLALSACAMQQVNAGEELDRSVKAFNRMLRWREVEQAGTSYVEQGRQEEFRKQAEVLKKRGITITDFRIISTKYLPEKKTGEVVTEFDYYILPSNSVKTISYRQEWIYQEPTKNWKITSGLEPFE